MMVEEEQVNKNDQDDSLPATALFRWVYSWWPPRWLLDTPETQQQNRKFSKWGMIYVVPAAKWVIRICEIFLLVLAMGVLAKITHHWLAEVLYFTLQLIFVVYFTIGIFLPFFLVLDRVKWRASCAVSLLLITIVGGQVYLITSLQKDLTTLIENAVELNLRVQPPTEANG